MVEKFSTCPIPAEAGSWEGIVLPGTDDGLTGMTHMRDRLAWVLPLLILISALSVDGGDVKKVHILLTGDIYPCPVISLCAIDPLFDYTPIQTREIPFQEAQRYSRLYFPRTREELFDYSMLFFVDGDMSIFNGRQVRAMLDAVEKGGVGTFWTFGPNYDSVMSCDLGRVIPHEVSREFNQWAWGQSFYRVRFRRGLPPVFTPFIDLGVENVRAYGCGQIAPRAGTTIWGDLIPFDRPWIVSWRFGGSGGVSWVAADDLDHPFWERTTYGFSENKYPEDILANIITYTIGRKLPENILLPIQIRREFGSYNEGKSLFVATLEFVEKFGADTSWLYDDMLTLDAGLVKRAKSSYLEGEYEDALSEMRSANQELRGLVDRALKARERALIWIFVVEWLVVSSTSMLSGFAVWTLMVKRRAYKEVITTRLLLR